MTNSPTARRVLGHLVDQRFRHLCKYLFDLKQSVLSGSVGFEVISPFCRRYHYLLL
jgi:hypothetical protein